MLSGSARTHPHSLITGEGITHGREYNHRGTKNAAVTYILLHDWEAMSIRQHRIGPQVFLPDYEYET